MDPKFNINNSQNVNIEVNFAGVGERLLALIIDGLVLGGIGMALSIAVATAQPGDTIVIIVFSIYTFAAMLYYFFMEWLFKGQTIGKKYQKIKVIHKSGTDASIFQLLIRNLIRVFDSIYGLGLLVIFFSKKSQRLGDLAAGTIVVKTHQNIKFNETAFAETEENYSPTFDKLEILRIDEKDIEIIKHVIERDTMEINWKIVGALATKIKAKAQINNNELKSLEVLKCVVKDFQYYHAG
ncbi:RDD family protein [Saccharicrinis aurantiacus]|uniref:RDD family protein n=1 Tax=Saccharicrinis aurantiacus TaxID=1849719 RepID=UPI00094F91E5|nr:RDD family protein [Saccharicrinis aurantiacus]